MKTVEIEKLKMLYGVKERNKSFKIYQKSDGEFIVIRNRYILGLIKIKKVLSFRNKEEAIDYIIQNTTHFHDIEI